MRLVNATILTLNLFDAAFKIQISYFFAQLDFSTKLLGLIRHAFNQFWA